MNSVNAASLFHTKQIPVLRTATPSLNRRLPLLSSSQSRSSPKGCCNARVAEVCGGTTADCAAVCCCCPIGLVNLLVLAIYKVPTGLFRRALLKRRRQRLMKRGLSPSRSSFRRCRCGCDGTEVQIHPIGGSIDGLDDEFLDLKKAEGETDEAVLALEKEMWNIFYSTGFWRSPSQRETLSQG